MALENLEQDVSPLTLLFFLCLYTLCSAQDTGVSRAANPESQWDSFQE